MPLYLEAFLLTLTIIAMIIGLIGTVVPILPGPLLIFLSVAGYAWATGWQEPTVLVTIGLLLLSAASGSAEFWLPYFGASKASGTRRAAIYGFIGGVIGMFLGFIIGSIIGYAAGVLLGTYQVHHDWDKAIKASLTGVAGRGAAMLVQLGGGILVIFLFVRAVSG